MRKLKYSLAINEALTMSMKKDSKVLVLGLGVDDPKGIFGTTLGLKEKYPSRVYDVPTAENGLTGVCIGLATEGFKPFIASKS